MRAVIYARYSSDLQDARSIADQIALASAHAQKHGWVVVDTYADAAISGASLHNRPALARLLTDAGAGMFDAVVTESLDRISRDLADISSVYRQLTFRSVRLVTLADGDVGLMHVGIKGLVGQMFLADLAQKTRRGQIGRVKAGRIPGSLCYGYRVVRDGGDLGRRTVDTREAEIVRRIFREFAAGLSGREIATGLNRDRVPSHTGRAWSASAILGSRRRESGILANRLYAGEIVYNRQTFVKDPETGRRVARVNPRSEWIVCPAPDLAIVDRDLWDRVAAARDHRGGPHPHVRRRPKRAFSGLLTCGACGGPMIIRSRDYVACSRRMNCGTCDNRRNVPMGDIESRVITAIEGRLLHPDAVAAAVDAYRIERERLARTAARASRDIDREIADIDRRTGRLVAAVEDGEAPAALLAQMRALDARRADLVARRTVPAAVAIHPNAASRYRAMVAGLRGAMAENRPDHRAAIGMLRDLVREIVIMPAAPGMPVGLEIRGDLAALVEHHGNDVTLRMVAGGRYGAKVTEPRAPFRISA